MLASITLKPTVIAAPNLNFPNQIKFCNEWQKCPFFLHFPNTPKRTFMVALKKLLLLTTMPQHRYITTKANKAALFNVWRITFSTLSQVSRQNRFWKTLQTEARRTMAHAEFPAWTFIACRVGGRWCRANKKAYLTVKVKERQRDRGLDSVHCLTITYRASSFV